MNEDLEYPWVEEYRPNKIEDVIGTQHLVEKLNEYIKKASIPHLLFIGAPGTGKTTIAKILAKSISGKDEYLYINASDRNNIDTIRNDVSNYAGTLGYSDALRIIILDEADGLTPQAQKSLRSVMEEYAKNCRFILTGNYGGRIIEALRSRCQPFEFEGASVKEIVIRCLRILQKKGVSITDQVKLDATAVVKACYPDIRKSINTIQKYTKGIEFKYIEVKDETKKEFIKLLKEGNIKAIRENILTSTVDFPSLFDAVFIHYKELTEDTDKRTGIIIHTSDYLYKHSSHLNPELNFVAYMLEIAQTLKG